MPNKLRLIKEIFTTKIMFIASLNDCLMMYVENFNPFEIDADPHLFKSEDYALYGFSKRTLNT